MAKRNRFYLPSSSPEKRGRGPEFLQPNRCSLGHMPRTCYDGTMKAFVGEVDQGGLRRFLPEDAIPRDELRRLARGPAPRSRTVVWILLDDRNAEDVRIEVTAGRHRAACGLLLNAAVELIPIAAAILEPAHTAWRGGSHPDARDHE